MKLNTHQPDAQWNAIQNFLPGDPGRTAVDNRLFVNAVLYVLKTGIPWSELPERFGKWNSIWRRYDRWFANGVWEKIFRALGEGDLTEVHLDSSSVKAHQTDATGQRDLGEKCDADDRRCLGLTRGAFVLNT